MSVFQRLRAILRTDVDRTYAADVKPIMDFSTVDIAKIKADLQLERRGRERGKQNEPPADQIDLDAVEAEIVSTITALRNEAHDDFTKQMSAYGGRLARLDLRTIAPEIKSTLLNAEADFGAEVQRDTNHIYARKNDVRAARDSYLQFRQRHQLDRLAEIDQNSLLNFGLLSFLFILETAGNATFFSATHPSGLIGAAFEAAAISIVNIAAGFVLGILGFRYVQHPGRTKPFGAWLLVIVLVALACVFNFSAAHYRDAFHMVPPDADAFKSQASKIALANLITHKWMLEGFQSYLMVIVGLIVFFGAAYKGYTWSDPYPGYKSVYRRFVKRQDEYLALVDGLVRNLQQGKDDAHLDLRETIADIRRRDSEYGLVIAERERLVRRYNSYVESLARLGTTLIETYRSVNRTARTAAAPLAFSSPWSSGWTHEPVVTDDTAAERRSAVTDVLASLSASQDRLLEAFLAALTQYSKLRDIEERGNAAP
jgi:hypothetical protein